MNYVMLIYTSEAADTKLSQAGQGAQIIAYRAFTDDVAAKGKMRGRRTD